MKKAKTTFDKHLKMPAIAATYKGSSKLMGKVAIITGGDSGIGRSVALHFAREGARVAIAYLKSDADAKETKALVEAEGVACLLVKGDLSKEANCKKLMAKTHKEFGKIDILVNNAGVHEEDDTMMQISTAQLKKTFEVNIFSFFYCTKAMLQLAADDAVIINTASVTAYRGSEHLIDYSSTKGAIVSFTRSLAKNLAPEGKRVNAVAPGPVWTPLVVNAFDNAHLKKFGKNTPMGRAGYPYEIAPAYVYLACADSAYMTGQVLHINGGDVVNS